MTPANKQYADIVLEGGGVKGIGLVGALTVLEQAGYEFKRVAGTSAGAIVGALVAADIPTADLLGIMQAIDYSKFKDKGALDHTLVGRAMSLLLEEGIYEGNYLKTWLSEVIGRYGKRTFADLHYEDAKADTPAEHRYRLVVIASDISCGRLAKLPWDYEEHFGLAADAIPIVDAVRASMSIPLFFEPIKQKGPNRNEPCWFVDGGMLSNFPIDIFDRKDGVAPRWPTLGIKLSAKAGARLTTVHDVHDLTSMAKAMAATATGFYDHLHLEDPSVVARTIFVDTFGIKATDFDLSPANATKLFDSGRRAADKFLASWNFEDYVATYRSAAVPPKVIRLDGTKTGAVPG
jgi:NTE family protein